jgi:hypothetical protein
MNCEWPALVKGARCVRCGRRLPADFKSPPASWCGDQPALVTCPARPLRDGWGDKLHRFLRVTRLALLAPPGCGGCLARRSALNTTGRRVGAMVGRLLRLLLPGRRRAPGGRRISPEAMHQD